MSDGERVIDLSIYVIVDHDGLMSMMARSHKALNQFQQSFPRAHMYLVLRRAGWQASLVDEDSKQRCMRSAELVVVRVSKPGQLLPTEMLQKGVFGSFVRLPQPV